eukprot:TRINITY_DN28585_c0_g2_i1.p1 TRINITY_DN28585_c0_g2~~TRINITY_DN28585_c0_g2_i1.p1  ORF type:complete len:484 (+),score=131.01 TRINITY_DN28585_c0_g2_i1:51-1454(+)
MGFQPLAVSQFLNFGPLEGYFNDVLKQVDDRVQAVEHATGTLQELLRAMSELTARVHKLEEAAGARADKEARALRELEDRLVKSMRSDMEQKMRSLNPALGDLTKQMRELELLVQRSTNADQMQAELERRLEEKAAQLRAETAGTLDRRLSGFQENLEAKFRHLEELLSEQMAGDVERQRLLVENQSMLQENKKGLYLLQEGLDRNAEALSEHQARQTALEQAQLAAQEEILAVDEARQADAEKYSQGVSSLSEDLAALREIIEAAGFPALQRNVGAHSQELLVHNEQLAIFGHQLAQLLDGNIEAAGKNRCLSCYPEMQMRARTKSPERTAAHRGGDPSFLLDQSPALPASAVVETIVDDVDPLVKRRIVRPRPSSATIPQTAAKANHPRGMSPFFQQQPVAAAARTWAGSAASGAQAEGSPRRAGTCRPRDRLSAATAAAAASAHGHGMVFSASLPELLGRTGPS